MAVPTVDRYDVFLADLDPTRGREIAKTRPVVIVSIDAMNKFSATVVVCPLTTKLHPRWRTRVPFTCAGKHAEIAVDQIRTISKERLVRRVDGVDPQTAARVRRLISEMYGEP